MSATLLDRVKAYLQQDSLTAGYSIRFNRFTDKIMAGNSPFVLLRVQASGTGTELLQANDVLVQLVQNENQTRAAADRMEQIMAKARSTDTETGLVRVDPVGNVRGPFYMENKRPMYELTLRAWTEDL